jgi:bifunctional ADP-heptose synthase (sugar kinase/adenylyltransferase)
LNAEILKKAEAEIIKDFITEARSLKVLVTGETITDEFIKVVYQGQSMKSFCPVFQLTDELPEQQLGGASAIYRHLQPFVGEIHLLSNSPEQIVKTRYIDTHNGVKHLEFNKFNLKGTETKKINVKDYDVVIVADFGHGYCDSLEINDGFHLMCQTNSHNFGFNRISKWKSKRKRSICIDLREASLQINHRIAHCSDEVMKEIYNYELQTEELFVTTGREGSVFTDGDRIIRHGSYPTNIIDTIGAGDAFFGFSALSSRLSVPGHHKLLVPSLAASLTTTWLCNEKSVTPNGLIEHANKYI